MEYNLPSEIVKDLNFGDQAKKRIINGVEKLATAVSSTLGASGKCVIYEDARGKPEITKDGVTVAESVVLFDPVENIGATLIKEAAQNTVREAGDGTTTATILAQSIIKEGCKYVTAGMNPMDVKRGIDTAVNHVKEKLIASSKKVKTSEEIAQVGTISANGEKEIGDMISKAMQKVGNEGVITVEEAKGTETELDVVEGMQFDRGYLSPYFITNADKMTTELENPYILIKKNYDPNVTNVTVDAEQIRRVFINLFENSIDALGNEGKIEISTKFDFNTNKILIRFSDYGTGIPSADRDMLFLPHFTTKKRGAGIGLAIVNRIVVDHGGTISVKNNQPRGTTFEIQIPPIPVSIDVEPIPFSSEKKVFLPF